MRCVLIGCGNIHSVHADAIMKTPSLELACVVDCVEERARAAAEKYHCEWETDYRKVLSRADIDSVHICTPHYLHSTMAIEAMEQGKHVLTEKPMAIDPLEARRMIEVSERTGRCLGVCFQNRYNATSVIVNDLLSSGELGEMTGGRVMFTWDRDESYYNSGEWRGTWEQEGGGVLINQAIHTLDLAQWFCGGFASVSACVSAHRLGACIEVEDSADAVFTTSNGKRLVFFASNCYCDNPLPLIEINCEKGSVRLEDNITVSYPNKADLHIENPVHLSGEKAYWGMSHELLIKDFYRCLACGEHFPIDGRTALKALELVTGCYRSSLLGRSIEF